MKNLFKSIALALVLMTSTSAFAQRSGLNEAGVNFGYMVGASKTSNFGIGVKYGHMFSDNLRAELGGIYYFKSSKNKTSWFDLDLNAHYLFPLGEKFDIYPIFGFAFNFGHTSINWKDVGYKSVDEWKADYEAASEDYEGWKKNGTYSDNHFRFGVNLGFGGEYNITDDFAVTLEAKYKLIKDFGSFNLMLGCAVLF